MRWRQAATMGITAFALLAIARPAGAVTYVGLHDLTCEGATTEGTGMPEGQRLVVALVDPASDRTMSRGRVTTSGSGTFEWRVERELQGRRAVPAPEPRPPAGQTPRP